VFGVELMGATVLFVGMGLGVASLPDMSRVKAVQQFCEANRPRSACYLERLEHRRLKSAGARLYRGTGHRRERRAKQLTTRPNPWPP